MDLNAPFLKLLLWIISPRNSPFQRVGLSSNPIRMETAVGCEWMLGSIVGAIEYAKGPQVSWESEMRYQADKGDPLDQTTC